MKILPFAFGLFIGVYCQAKHSLETNEVVGKGEKLTNFNKSSQVIGGKYAFPLERNIWKLQCNYKYRLAVHPFHLSDFTKKTP